MLIRNRREPTLPQLESGRVTAAELGFPVGNPVAQPDNVHSILRLNYETLRKLISLASPSVAKPTGFETASHRCTLGDMLDLAETPVKWEPVDGISFDFISAEVFSVHPDLWVRLIDGRVDVPEHHDLIFHFSRVAGFTVHEEFAHPTQGTVWGREPVISPECKATFPCLVITGSPWFKSLGDELAITYEGAVHYRRCSDFPVVDIVSPVQPLVRWFVRPRSAQELPRPSWAQHSRANADDKQDH